jgi:hypothetical protein
MWEHFGILVKFFENCLKIFNLLEVILIIKVSIF